MSLAVYVHVPFCEVRCRYCGFFSRPLESEDVDTYLSAVLAEAERQATSFGRAASTLYIGGGTPTAIGAERLCRLIEGLQRIFSLEAGAEVTVEANPHTVSPQLLRDIVGVGVNRLSIGVQALTMKELCLLGRSHRAAEAVEAVERALDTGTAVNVDLMYGLPGQTLADWEWTLRRAISWNVHHLSLYPLEIHAGPMQDLYEESPHLFPDDDQVADQFELARSLLAGTYEHYELSNWCRPGKQCLHNLAYWRNEYYLGLGASAHSHLPAVDPSGGAVAVRCWHPDSIPNYLAGRTVSEPVTAEQWSRDRMMMGLRLAEGVTAGELNLPADVVARIDRLVECGALVRAGARVHLAPSTLFTSNAVIGDILYGPC